MKFIIDHRSPPTSLGTIITPNGRPNIIVEGDSESINENKENFNEYILYLKRKGVKEIYDSEIGSQAIGVDYYAKKIIEQYF